MRKWLLREPNLSGEGMEETAGEGGEKLIYLAPESSFLRVTMVKELNIFVVISGPGPEVIRGRGRARWLKSRNTPPKE